MRRCVLALLCTLVAAPNAAAMPLAPPEPPLFSAIEKGDLPRVKRLAKAGADLGSRDPMGRTPLVRAAAANQPALVAYFVGKNADLDARDLYGNGALHYAAQIGAEGIAKTLLAAGASPRLYNRRCQSALDVAAGFGREAFFKAIKAPVAAAPLPADGTVEECGVTDKVPAYAKAFAAYHARQLKIESFDDYPYAAESLAYVEKHAPQSATLVVPLLALVSSPMPEGALSNPDVDLGLRRGAVQTLAKVARTKPARAQVAAELLKVVAAGGCSAYKPRTCLAAKVEACREKEDERLYAVWPRDEEAEACFNCLHCEQATIGHEFAAALEWFAADKDHQPEAAKALDRLRDKHLLPKAEHKRLKARIQSR